VNVGTGIVVGFSKKLPCLSNRAVRTAGTHGGYRTLIRPSKSSTLSPFKTIGFSSVSPSDCDDLGNLNMVAKTLASLRIRRRLWILKSLSPTFDGASVIYLNIASKEHPRTHEEDDIAVLHIIFIMSQRHCGLGGPGSRVRLVREGD
jgi:hypothetical protein